MNIVKVALNTSKLSISKKIERGRFIVASMTGNSNFPLPNPTLASVTTSINVLEAAQIAAMGGGTEDTANMHNKESLLDLSLKLLAFYVESIASANPVTAEAVILSSGINVKTKSSHAAKEFNVSVTGKPGEIKLVTKFVNRATFFWQMCTDPSNELGWKIIAQGTKSKILISDLISTTRYYFRVSVITKDGQGPWSNVINIVSL